MPAQVVMEPTVATQLPTNKTPVPSKTLNIKITKGSNPKTLLVDTLAIPELKDKIQIQPDGSVVIQGFTTKHPIKISTPGKIIIVGPIDADKLILHGKEIMVQKPIIANSLILQADNLLKNAHTLQAKELVIAGTGLYENFGLTRAEQFSLEIKKTKNLGTILGAHICTQESRLKKPAVAATSVGAGSSQSVRAAKTIKPEQIDNFGMICCQGKLSLETNKDIINHPGAEILCYGDSHFFPNGHFFNKAKILCKGKCIAMAALGIENLDTITAENGMQLLCDGKGVIHNKGSLQSAKVISVFNTEAFYNHPNATVQAEIVRAQSKSIFSNSGLISGTEETTIGADGKILNTKTGNIYSKNRVKVVGLAALENYGSITGQRRLTTRTVGETLNHLEGQLTSEALRSVSRKLKNDGLMLGSKHFDITSQNVQNSASGVMGSENIAHFTVYQDCHNQGKLSARILGIKACNLINQFKEGQIICFDALTLEIQHHLENANLIRAEGEIKLLAERVSNSKTATVQAKGAITIQGKASQNDGLIVCEKDITLSGNTFENTNTVQAKNKIQIQAMEVTNSDTAVFRAKDINADVGILDNRGAIIAERDFNLEVIVFHNLLKALIFAGENLIILAKAKVCNAGKLSSQGKILLKAELIIHNLKTGQMVAVKDLELLADLLLENAGLIFSEKTASLKSHFWILNHPDASIRAKEAIGLASSYCIENDGGIYAQGRCAIEALEYIKNFSRGVIKSEQGTSLASAIIDNFGAMVSDRCLNLDARLFLNNHRLGVLLAKDTLAISAAILRHEGVAKAKEISAVASLLIQTMEGSQIFAKRRLDLLSGLAIVHNGLLVAEHILMHSTGILNLLSEGLAFSTGDLVANSSIINNQSKLKGRIATLLSDIFINHSNGQISAKEFLNIQNRNFALNSGLIEALDARIVSQILVNTGCIHTRDMLLLDIQAVIQQLSTGILSSNGSIQLLAPHAYLAGLIMANRTAAVKTRHLDYALDTQWSCGLLHLILQSAFNFTKPLLVQGGLMIHALDLLRINATIQSSQSMFFDVPSLIIESYGLLAKETLALNCIYNLQINRGAYCNSLAGLKAKTYIFQNAGEIYAEDILIDASHSVENTGYIIGKRDVEITAPRIRHFQMGQEKPVISAGNNCILRGNIEVEDGLFSIQGQFIKLGSFQYISLEMQIKLKELNEAAEAAYQEECRQAKRKRKKALFKNLLSIAASIAITYFVPGTQTVGLTILRGALSGGVSSLISGRNPLKGAFKEALLAGIGFGINSGVTKFLSNAPFPVIVKTSFITAVNKTATTAISTTMNGGKLGQNLAIQVGSGLIGNAMHTNPSSNNIPPTVTITESIADSLITSALTAAVTHTKLGEDMLWAGLHGVIGGVMHTAGSNLRPRLYPEPLQQTKPQPFGLPAFEDFQRSYMPIYQSRNKNDPLVPNVRHAAPNPVNKPSAKPMAPKPSSTPRTDVNPQPKPQPPKNPVPRQTAGNNSAGNSKAPNPNKGSSLFGDILNACIPQAYADEMVDVRKSKPTPSKKGNEKLTPLEKFNAAMMLTEHAEDRLSLGMGAGGTVVDKTLNFQFKTLVKIREKILQTLESNQRHCRALEARHNVPANASGCHDPLFYALQFGAYLIPGSPKETVFNFGGVVTAKRAPKGLHWLYKEYRIHKGLEALDKDPSRKHVFSKAKGGKAPRYGHIEDTPENRRLLVETLIENRLVMTDEWGVKTFAKDAPNNCEFWVQIRPNGQYRSAGLNEEPRYLKPLELWK